ncbi:MAG TPA: 30S ribosomal protein S4 [Dehalococcoidia bacterium]|nr:30S ribosomal protein S4 [Dehalococcoidia bacterium]
MARYTGPVCRICRGLGEKLYLKGEKCFSKCTIDKRPTPPGQRSTRRRKVSDRGIQLREKQKVRFHFGMMERQFVRFYEEAVRRPGISGDNLLKMLEMRMDSAVYHMGFADSRAQARQLVKHGLLAVNGRKSTIPSRILRVGDIVSLTERGQKSEYFKAVKENIGSKQVPEWLSVDGTALTARVLAEADITEANERFNTAMIVEYYSR